MTSANHHPDRVAKNTTFLTLAQAVQKILSFVYFAFIASKIGADNIGKYVWVLSFTGIFALIMEFGLSRVLTREVAKDYSKAKHYLANILGIKIWLTVLTLIIAVITINVMHREPIVVLMVYLALIIIILDNFTQTFFSIFRAFQILKYESISIVIYQAIIVTCGYLVIKFNFGLKALIIAVLAGSLFNFLYSLILVIAKAKITPNFSFNKETVKFIIIIAIPFALYGIFYKISLSIDSVMLGLLASDRYVGWYAVASKITQALTFIPGAFATSLFPAFSHYFVTSKEYLKITFEKAMFYMMVISMPITVGVFILADKIILKMYGPVFGASVVAAQIFIVGLVFIFLNFPIGNLLNACNKQVINTVNMAITMVFNIILNYFLIPKYNFRGASIAALLSAILLVFLGLPHINKIIIYSKKYLIQKFITVFLAALAMGGFVYLMKQQINIILIVPMSAIIYFILLFIFRAINKAEIIGLIRSVLRRNGDLQKE